MRVDPDAGELLGTAAQVDLLVEEIGDRLVGVNPLLHPTRLKQASGYQTQLE
jgi:hypothetical protein